MFLRFHFFAREYIPWITDVWSHKQAWLHFFALIYDSIMFLWFYLIDYTKNVIFELNIECFYRQDLGSKLTWRFLKMTWLFYFFQSRIISLVKYGAVPFSCNHMSFRLILLNSDQLGHFRFFYNTNQISIFRWTTASTIFFVVSAFTEPFRWNLWFIHG